jgi:hypothetical protein
MRKGEVLGLTWDRVDFARGVLLLDGGAEDSVGVPLGLLLEETACGASDDEDLNRQ